MENVWALAALWVGLALLATLLAIWFRISTASTEIVFGMVAQLNIGAFIVHGGLTSVVYAVMLELGFNTTDISDGHEVRRQAMNIVVISDLHSNFDALSALPELGDELWVLGDLVNYGPMPAEVVAFVRSHSEIVIRGNHDCAVGFDVDPGCTPRYEEMADKTMQYSKANLDSDATAFLRGLPLTRAIERDDHRFFLCHAIPSNPLYGYCPEDSDLWPKELEQVEAEFLLVGHTHTPFIRTIGSKTICNPGSLGQPKTGKADACYAVWEDGKFRLKQFAYPVDRAVQRIEQLPVPADIKRDLATVLRTGSV